MTPLLQSSTSTKDWDLIFKPPEVDLSQYSLDPSTFSTHKSFTDISNVVQCSPTADPVIGPSADDLSPLSRSQSTMHFGRVATVDHHDLDAWTQERKVHDAKLNTAVISSSLGSNSTAPDDILPVSLYSLMEPQTEPLWTVEPFPEAGWFREGTAIHSHNRESGSYISLVQPDVTIGLCMVRDIFESRRGFGEILVHCGAIDHVSEMSPVECASVGCCRNSGALLVDVPVVSSVELPFGEDDGLVMTALANWTSEWVHTLVIQPYLQGSFSFQFQGTLNRASVVVASRIRRVLGSMENPVQVVIHALWFISALTESGAHDSVSFLSVPIFRYLHNNGTVFAEDFMLRIFVACAMIGDKTVNDATLSTGTWNRWTRIPHVALNATEKYVLSDLKWNVVMTQTQWQDTIMHLRSCIKMGSAFDPFSYDETSSSGVMARYLDELMNLNHADRTYTFKQEDILLLRPMQHPTQWEVFDTAEWCPEDDPVINQKPRTVGIAPGPEESASIFKVQTTAKDLLDSITEPSNVYDPVHLAQPAGTYFCCSFGVIGAQFADNIRIANACQRISWVPSHG